MRRHLLDLCVLGYPRARRERDRDYLRDLALDLAETHGLTRQALSLLLGGLNDRIELLRQRGGTRSGTWVRRALVASLVLATLAVAAIGLIGTEGSASERVHEFEQFVCMNTDHPPSRSRESRVDGASGCGETRRLVAARKREGWDCTRRRRMRQGPRSATWECRGRRVSALN